MKDEYFMHIAIEEAQKAAAAGDVPVGAVLVRNSADGFTAISVGHNTRECDRTVLGHAEINALREGCAALGSWRLSDCTLYVTLEPCPMCAGAILQARIGRVVCGTQDPSVGAMGSRWSIHRHELWRDTQIEYGCLENECRELLQTFFKEQRKSPDFMKKS